MKPWIAICNHGRLRKAKESANEIPKDDLHSLKYLRVNILNDHENDIFAHRWSNQENFD